MGNTDSVVVQKRLVRFRPEERPVVESVFDKLLCSVPVAASGKAGKTVSLDTLKTAMGVMTSDAMVQRLFDSMCSIDPCVTAPPGGGVSREQLVVFLADILRGTAEERAPLVMAMSAGTTATSTTKDHVQQFMEDLVAAVVQTLSHRGRLRGWRLEQMGGGLQGEKRLAEQLCSELKPSDEGVCDVPCLEDWIFRTSNISTYLELLVGEGLGVELPSRAPPTLLPQCSEAQWAELRCMLDLPLLLFLTPLLPDGHSAPWRLLFSTQLHGESFTRLVGGVRGRGPTVLIARDSKGHVFGGYASHSWDLKPQFQGDSRCFVFTVSPCMRAFPCTGYNQHYMYLNQGQQTLPNGLGMGGQHSYFGLWLDSDFGKGHSRARPRCTTFGSPQLSADEEFTLDTLEVWGVGLPPQQQDQDEQKRSVLDADPEVQAMMEMTGKTLHSHGLREPEED